MLAAYGITDEIFAVASSQPHKITPSYMYGLIFSAFLGWSGGTFIGAYAGQIMPQNIITAMGIVLYGMFIAIIIPASKKKKSVLTAVILAAAFSVIFKYLITAVSEGFAIIISAAAASVLCALLFKDTEDTEE